MIKPPQQSPPKPFDTGHDASKAISMGPFGPGYGPGPAQTPG